MGFFSSKSTTENKTKLNKQALGILNPQFKASKDLLANQPGYYDFNTVAGMNGYQQAGINQMANGGSGDIAQQLYGSGTQGLGVLDRYYGGQVNAPQLTNEDIQGFYNSDLVNDQVNAATDTASQFLDRYLGNDIASSAVATGNTGSSRRGIMEGQAIGDAATGLANTTAGIRNNEYGRAAGLAAGNIGQEGDANQLNAANMSEYLGFTGNNLSNASNLYNQDAQNKINAGGMLQNQDQRYIAANMDQHLWDYNQGWNAVNQYANINSPAWGLQDSKSTTRSRNSGFDILKGAVTTAASAMGGMPSMGSGGGGSFGGMPQNYDYSKVGGYNFAPVNYMN
jgi:hypothetical protein